MAEPFPFGVKTVQSFVVLDKSFLQGVNSAQLQYYVQMGWTFGLTEALMYEHFRKRDPRRIANLWTCPGCVDTPRSTKVQLGVDDGETRAGQAADVFG
jgi:hypothetical protein